MVAVVLKFGETMTPEELLDFCQEKMPYFMVPRFIEFMDQLPKSVVHRILKRVLKKRGVTQETYDREKEGYTDRTPGDAYWRLRRVTPVLSGVYPSR